MQLSVVMEQEEQETAQSVHTDNMGIVPFGHSETHSFPNKT